MWMEQILERHNQLTHPWKGFLGSQGKPRSEPGKTICRAYVWVDLLTQAPVLVSSVLLMFKYGSSWSEMEQLLCSCSGFLYLEMERFLTNVSAAKLAALNMSGTVQPYIGLLSMI